MSAPRLARQAPPPKWQQDKPRHSAADYPEHGPAGKRDRRARALKRLSSVNISFEYRMDAVPAVRQHNEAIQRELGCSENEIAAMRDAGVV